MTEKINKNLELNGFLPYRLSALSNRVSESIAKEYAEQFKLNVHMWRVMAVIGQQPNITAAEIAQKTVMEKVTISRAINSLDKLGYIQSQKDAQDKRKTLLNFTTTGEKIYQQIVPIAMKYEESLLASLSQTEQQSLDSILLKLNQVIDQW